MLDVSGGSRREIVCPAVPDDERLWVPSAPGVAFTPLFFDTVNGGWADVGRARTTGVISRHHHPAPVHAYVIKGSLRYQEHGWVASAGSYMFEPPGDTHTLIVDEGVDEMITFFYTVGCLIYVDDDGRPTGYDDVHTRIASCRAHFEAVGLGSDFIERYIR